MQAKYKLVNLLLQELEVEIAAINWPAQPSAAALASSLPFCADTMALTSWLAWVFLPKMRELIASQAALPEACGLSEQVEMQLTAKEQARLLPLTRAIDALLSENKMPPASLLKKLAEKS